MSSVASFLGAIFRDLILERKSSLLNERKLDTFTLRKRNSRSLAITNDKAVGDSSGERVTRSILDVSDVEGTLMSLDGLEDTDSTNVVTAGKHDSGTVGELDNGADLTAGEVDLDRVVEADVGVREADGSTVVGGDVRNLLLVDGLADDLAELEAGLLSLDSVSLESALDVEEDSEVLVGALDGDDVHGTEREARVSSDLAVDLDEALLVLDDGSSLSSAESVLESLLEEHVERDALSELVGTRRRSGAVDTSQLAEVPLLGGSDSLDDLSLTLVTHF